MKPTLSDAEFAALAAILEDLTGLVHDEARRDALAFAAAACREAAGIPTFGEFLHLLGSEDGEAVRQRLIDAVTIQETHFFRNPPQIRALRTHVLPELIRTATAADRPLVVWSAGCSTGEEPYTVAMLVRELLPNATPDRIRILGTDISSAALDAARRARYGPRAVQMAEPVDVARWFTRVGEEYVVRDEVRELVEFQRHNLVRDPPPFEPGSVDLLLCRNVTIYFRRQTTKALMRRLHDVLREGGYLFLGHAETLWQMTDAFTLVTLGDAFVYRRLPPEHDGERRILPQRRTGAEPVLTERRRRTDRRSGPAHRARLGAVERAPVRSGAGPRRDGGNGAADLRVPPTAGDARTADYLAEARGALAAGRYQDAVRAAGAVLKAEPLLAEAHVIHGEALVNLGRDAEAVPQLRQAVYLDPDHAPAHLLLAGALERLGEAAAAGRAYRAAAATVRRLPPARVAEFFAGRQAEELAAACLRLAQQAERAAARQRHP